MQRSKINTIRPELLTKKFQDALLPFLEEVGISPEIFHDPSYDCPLDKLILLLEVAAERRNEPNLGLNFGKRVISTDFGLMGQAIRSQESCGDMIQWLEKYFVIHQQASSISYQIDKNKLSLSYQIDDPSILDKRQDSEFSIAAIHALLMELNQIKPKLLRVEFGHKRPQNIAEHQAFFQCPVQFDRPHNRLVYSAELFDSKLETRNHVILEALDSYIEDLHKHRSSTSDFITQLDIVISKQLNSGGTNLPRVADQMAMSARTLQRRLSELNIHFGDHVEELKQKIAIHYITNDTYSLTEIALFLGYSEASSFSRAFKRWTGLTPGQYRKQHHTKSG